MLHIIIDEKTTNLQTKSKISVVTKKPIKKILSRVTRTILEVHSQKKDV